MKLLVDVMLGRLVSYLRMCGHDASYALDRGVEADDAILEAAHAEDRRIVTRDRDLAGRAPDAILLERRDIEGQLRELAAVGVPLELTDPARCGRCNAPVEPVEPTASTPTTVPDASVEPVWRCSACGQHFWRGSHWDDVRDRLASL